jgi:hypothetical protein
MDGYYPYHEMDAYMGLIALVLAVAGAGGPARRDRWTNFWVLLIGLGAVLMLGKFTVLFDHANAIPVLGSSREPVRFHLWVALGVAALAAAGVERLYKPGAVSLRGGLILAGLLVVLSIPIMVSIYSPIWTHPDQWKDPEHIQRFRWLAGELIFATIRTSVIAALGWWFARRASRAVVPARRARWAAAIPLLVIADLLGAHAADVPTVSPKYWTDPPKMARWLKSEPRFIRVFGLADKSAGEPGYASRRVDFLSVRDPLDWSLPLVWHLASSRGRTPMISRRLVEFTEAMEQYSWRYDLEGDTHVVIGRGLAAGLGGRPVERIGTAVVYRNFLALARARLVGRPIYARDERQAVEALKQRGTELRDRLVVEDPSRPLPVDAVAVGTARIVEDLPERVVVEAVAESPSYLVLADTFDPGWSATLDGQPVPIRPAYVAFRAVYLPEGTHTVAFSYQPAGFTLGLGLTLLGVMLGLVLWFWPAGATVLAPDHASLCRPELWRMGWYLALTAIVLISIPIPVIDPGLDGGPVPGPDGRPRLMPRWKESFHGFTWGAKLLAMPANRPRRP